MSLRAFAKHLGVTDRALRKAIISGRLAGSLGTTASGKPCISNPELAAKEWEAVRSQPSPGGSASASSGLAQAQMRVAEQREASLRIANEQRAGRLIDAERARRDAFACARAVRDAVLNVPDRLAAELAAESDAARVHERLDLELRKALELVAEVLARGE
jgi:hypothetical protein